MSNMLPTSPSIITHPFITVSSFWSDRSPLHPDFIYDSAINFCCGCRFCHSYCITYIPLFTNVDESFDRDTIIYQWVLITFLEDVDCPMNVLLIDFPIPIERFYLSKLADSSHHLNHTRLQHRCIRFRQSSFSISSAISIFDSIREWKSRMSSSDSEYSRRLANSPTAQKA